MRRRLPLAAVVLLTACVGPTSEPTATGDPAMPVTTLAPTPESSVDPGPDSSLESGWPTVRAASFIHRPSGFGIPTSSLTSTTCYQCTTVALRDGRVLLIGDNHVAEIWDPDTGRWASTGRPNSEPGWGGPSKAVVLRDDRVMFALTSPSVHTDATRIEIYDPAEGSFRLLEPVLPYGTVPVVMTDGRVLLATSLRGGVVFDPADESFDPVGESTPDSGYPFSGPIGLVPDAVALTDGRVLLVAESRAAVYDPDTEEFTPVTPAYPTTWGFALALLQDGRVLVTGGSARTSTESMEDLGSTEAQVFDPTTDRFTAVGSMLEPRSHHSAVTIADGRVVIVGGDVGRVEVFDPETATFEQALWLTRPRQSPTAVLLNGGTLLVVGGAGADILGEGTLDPTTPRTAEIYHPNRRDREPSTTGLSGFTLRLEVDFDRDQIESPNSEISLLLVVPPSGLQGATFGMASAVGYRRDGGQEGAFHPLWVYPDGVAPGPEFWGGTLGPDAIKLLPAACQQGCEIREEIREMLFDGEGLGPSTARLLIQFHIQYEGDIPSEAEGITLTVVETG